MFWLLRTLLLIIGLKLCTMIVTYVCFLLSHCAHLCYCLEIVDHFLCRKNNKGLSNGQFLQTHVNVKSWHDAIMFWKNRMLQRQFPRKEKTQLSNSDMTKIIKNNITVVAPRRERCWHVFWKQKLLICGVKILKQRRLALGNHREIYRE